MNSSLRRIGIVVAICAFAGALAGIAGSMAAPSSKSSKSKSNSAKAQALRHAKRFGPLRFGFGPGPGGGPVHSETVIPNESGDNFVTITTDAGKLKSRDGSKLTLTEGTDKATYGTPTIDVGSSPKVFRNHAPATLDDLKTDDEVRIIQSPRGTLVWAEDAAFQAQEQKMRQNFERGHRHFRGKFGPGGPGGPGWGPPPPGGGSYPGDDGGSPGSSGNSNS